MNRFREYGFWISLTGAIILLLQIIGKQFGFYVNEAFISECVTAFCGVLVIMGILIKPKEEKDDDDHDDDKTSNHEKEE